MQPYFARHALTAKHRGGETVRHDGHRKARFHQPEPSARSRNILASTPLAQRPAIKPCGVMWCKSKPGVLQLLRMVRLSYRLRRACLYRKGCAIEVRTVGDHLRGGSQTFTGATTAPGVVRAEGVEPPSPLGTAGPKPAASASSATPALKPSYSIALPVDPLLQHSERCHSPKPMPTHILLQITRNPSPLSTSKAESVSAGPLIGGSEKKDDLRNPAKTGSSYQKYPKSKPADPCHG